MYLDLRTHDYDKDIIPFIKNGIIIDTMVVKKIIDGLIDKRISKKEAPELDTILAFLELIKISGKWEKFFITPHILSEVCWHLRDDYQKSWGNDFYKVIENALPLLKSMNEKMVEKENFLEQIDEKKPIIEAGDISIFVVSDDFIKKNEKLAILSEDSRIISKYKTDERIMIMDYQYIMLNQL